MTDHSRKDSTQFLGIRRSSYLATALPIILWWWCAEPTIDRGDCLAAGQLGFKVDPRISSARIKNWQSRFTTSKIVLYSIRIFTKDR